MSPAHSVSFGPSVALTRLEGVSHSANKLDTRDPLVSSAPREPLMCSSTRPTASGAHGVKKYKVNDVFGLVGSVRSSAITRVTHRHCAMLPMAAAAADLKNKNARFEVGHTSTATLITGAGGNIRSKFGGICPVIERNGL